MKKVIILIVFLVLAFQINYAQDAKKYTTYIVKKGETLKSIAKKLGCRTKVIKNLNPDVRNNPKVNTTLVVPNKNFGKKKPKIVEKPKKKIVTYTVKQGDTFFGIAKKYNVTIQSIKDANPDTKNGLQPGQTIRIPNKDEFTVNPNPGKVQLYKVKKGDTKWNISQKHNISITELEHLNPDMGDDLQLDEKIWVPVPENIDLNEVNDSIAPKNEDLQIYHEVKQGEGLFRIAVMYNTTQEELRKLNPEATKKLRPGMLLKIPGKKKTKFLVHEVKKGDTFFSLTHAYNVTEENLIKLNPELKDGLKLGMQIKIKELEKADSNVFKDSISTEKQIHISFMMPLMVDEKINLSENNRATKIRNICTDFYMGAKIAIDSLQASGMPISYHVYDTKNDILTIHELLKDETLQSSDAIIGPFFFKNAEKVADELPETPILTPLFSKKQLQDTHENLIKTVPTDTNLLDGLNDYFKSHYNKQKVVIITDGTENNKNKAIKIGNFFKGLDSITSVQYIHPSFNEKHPEDLYLDKEKIDESIDDKHSYWVVLVSDKKVINSDVVNGYGVLVKDDNIRLFTTKVFDDFGYLGYNSLARLNWTFPSTQFDLLNDKTVTSFKEKYQNQNHAHATMEAFTGYDLTFDTLMRLSSGKDFKDGITSGYSNRLSRKFDYQKTSNNDYRNKGILVISFNKELEFILAK